MTPPKSGTKGTKNCCKNSIINTNTHRNIPSVCKYSWGKFQWPLFRHSHTDTHTHTLIHTSYKKKQLHTHTRRAVAPLTASNLSNVPATTHPKWQTACYTTNGIGRQQSPPFRGGPQQPIGVLPCHPSCLALNQTAAPVSLDANYIGVYHESSQSAYALLS